MLASRARRESASVAGGPARLPERQIPNAPERSAHRSPEFESIITRSGPRSGNSGGPSRWSAAALQEAPGEFPGAFMWRLWEGKGKARTGDAGRANSPELSVTEV
ncbi:hypothetical protein GCM10010315_49700 [Streptomyces luteosporeus]|uniref:Uncharacterized protein n=1 Tax=Streptomyces luteosporeus TaxID=173856 RepID=A0ABP6GKP4_9ACTN